jgi:transcriptional regulator with XRE-family HTH domain
MLTVEPEIGPTLRRMRLERKWTQAALAVRLGINLDWLQKIELGSRTPNPELIEKINAWLGDANARLR